MTNTWELIELADKMGLTGAEFRVWYEERMEREPNTEISRPNGLTPRNSSISNENETSGPELKQEPELTRARGVRRRRGKRKVVTGPGAEDGPSGVGPEPAGLQPAGASCRRVPAPKDRGHPVTLSIVSAWRNKRGQPCSAYIWSILGLLATAAIIDAMASAQHLWTSDRMVLSDFNYQNGVILVNIFSVFFLLGSFLSTGLRDRVIFKSHRLKSRERSHDDTSSPLGIFVCWPLRTHLANVVLRSKVIMEDVPLLPHRYKCGLLLQQLSNHLSEGWHKTMTTGRFVATILRVLWIDVMWTVVSTLGYFGSVIIKVPILESLIEAPDNWNRATSATLFAAASVADLLFCSYQTHVSLRLCARVRSMLQAAIFNKMTRLSPSALTRNPSGYVVSVLGVDCVQLSASALQFPLPIIGSLCMPVVLWVLALRAGTVPAVGCALWLMIVLFLPFPTSVLQNILWKRVMRFRDERLKSTADLLSSVRVVKLYAWEDAYLGTVGRLRDAELAALLRTNLLDGLMDSLYSSTSSLARDPLCNVN
ncbi:hypothetical protein HPB51_024518 [Rhipicephalus microplus]|uniref:ABC transmembrane type-1 domain-containing protein n=1 Tax=Rhipicephalus microplus TaxID=6941 RepID=A0A9J6EE79_RHIMP|nr:hypothetical protein HPB51_024518 [Rhipicephalus microplus]